MAWLARREFRVAGAAQYVALLCVPHARLSVHVRPPILNAPMHHAGKARAGNAPNPSGHMVSMEHDVHLILYLPTRQHTAFSSGIFSGPLNQGIDFRFSAPLLCRFSSHFTFRKVLGRVHEAACRECGIYPNNPKHFGVCTLNLDDLITVVCHARILPRTAPVGLRAPTNHG